jgi:hypothetical protein
MLNHMPKKTVLLATDGTIPIQTKELAKALNRICKHIKFDSAKEPIGIKGAYVSSPESYKKIEKRTTPLLKSHSTILIATALPYDNNWFMESHGKVVILSFSGWDFLTNIPANNGMAGFVARIVANELDSTLQHDQNSGCAYDFLWDKTGIDNRLRSGATCRSCTKHITSLAKKFPDRQLSFFDCTIAQGLEDLLSILDFVSSASKREQDVIQHHSAKKRSRKTYDVFLCHNSADKPEVRKLFAALEKENISPWFDERHLQPGVPWQTVLENEISRIKSAAIIVGPNGKGPWQDLEVQAFLSEFTKRRCRMIPVILESSPKVPNLPIFLKSFTWVDFRKSDPDPMKQLIWGITGSRSSD